MNVKTDAESLKCLRYVVMCLVSVALACLSLCWQVTGYCELWKTRPCSTDENWWKIKKPLTTISAHCAEMPRAAETGSTDDCITSCAKSLL